MHYSHTGPALLADAAFQLHVHQAVQRNGGRPVGFHPHAGFADVAGDDRREAYSARGVLLGQSGGHGDGMAFGGSAMCGGFHAVFTLQVSRRDCVQVDPVDTLCLQASSSGLDATVTVLK